MKLIKGDITKSDAKLIGHGVNTIGVMGAGVALALAREFPGLEREYQEYISKEIEGWVPNKNHLLGNVHWYVDQEKGKTVANIFIQTDVGQDGKKYGKYTAVANGLVELAKYSWRVSRGRNKIAIPTIGCGLAGLKWEIVSEMIQEVEGQFGVEFEVYYL